MPSLTGLETGECASGAALAHRDPHSSAAQADQAEKAPKGAGQKSSPTWGSKNFVVRPTALRAGFLAGIRAAGSLGFATA
jgi:hypothetical protein